jgi:hypothetical protein
MLRNITDNLMLRVPPRHRPVLQRLLPTKERADNAARVFPLLFGTGVGFHERTHCIGVVGLLDRAQCCVAVCVKQVEIARLVELWR